MQAGHKWSRILGSPLLTVADTPPNISYYTPSTAECDVELPDSNDDISYMWDSKASPEPMTGIEQKVSVPSVNDLLDQARQHKFSLQTKEAIRFFLRALFVASLALNDYLSDQAWTKCLDELSSLLTSMDAKGLQIHTLFREEFSLTERNLGSNHEPAEKRLKLIWKGFLRHSIGSWTQNSRIVCESLVNSFPASGIEIDRWRCRLELVKELSYRNLNQKAHEHHALAFSECLRQRKAIRETDFTGVWPHWPELLSGCGSNPSFVYHIMSIASQYLTTGWWKIGQELLAEMKGELETVDYGRIPEKWMVLFIKIFESCYGHAPGAAYRPEAECWLAQAIKIMKEFFLKDGKCGTKVHMLSSECKRLWIKISDHHYHRNDWAPSTIEQIRDINERLRNMNGKGLRLLLVDSRDMAKNGANRDCARDNNSDNGEGDFGDGESLRYGVTYTESLSSCPSMNYSALFPPGHGFQ